MSHATATCVAQCPFWDRVTHNDPWVVAPHSHVLRPGGSSKANGQDEDRHHQQGPHKPKGSLLSSHKPFWEEDKQGSH